MLLCVLSISSGNIVCNAQNNIQLGDIEMVNLGDKQLYAHKRGDYDAPITGKTRIITGVTTEYIDAEFKDGFAVGNWEYYANNNKMAVMNYVDGYLDGEFSEYYSGGGLEIKGYYLKGQKHGTWETFNGDGTIKLMEVYENDKIAKIISYHTNGSVDRERNFKNGKEHGFDKQYTSEGTLKSERNYVDGKQVGPQTQFYLSNAGDYTQKSSYNEQGQLDGSFSEIYESTGTVKIKGHYLKGQKHGTWETFKNDGVIKLTEVYENDKVTKKITYYTDGSVERERGLKDGKDHGLDKQYTFEGTLKSEKNYVNGKQVGPQMQFYSSNAGNYIQKSNYNEQGQLDGSFSEIYESTGTVKTKGKYKNGRKDGKWTYGYSHALYKEEIYEDGKLTETIQLNK